jgi:hypothetical protein
MSCATFWAIFFTNSSGHPVLHPGVVRDLPENPFYGGKKLWREKKLLRFGFSVPDTCSIVRLSHKTQQQFLLKEVQSMSHSVTHPHPQIGKKSQSECLNDFSYVDVMSGYEEIAFSSKIWLDDIFGIWETDAMRLLPLLPVIICTQ